jgi:tetratricopeptide (TPR) repeat protein
MSEAGDPWEQALVYTTLGEVERQYGTVEGAADAYQHALQLLDQIGGELFLTGVNYHNLGQTALLLGNLETAEAQFLRSFAAGRQLGATKLSLHSLTGLANVARAGGRPVAAARLLGCADAAFARAGYELHPADEGPRDKLEAALRESLGDAAYQELHAQGARLDPQEMVATGELFEGALS